MLAGSAALFGLNNFSMMLPSLLLGAGTLLVVYLIGRDVLMRPWLGVAAAVVLATMSIETWYATGPRMYMPVQFFTVLAVYCFWRGFVEGETAYKALGLAALIAGTLSNQVEAAAALALPLAVLPVLRLRGQPWPQIFSARNVAIVLTLGVVAYWLATLRLGEPMPLIIGHAGRDPERVGLNLSPVNWGRHVLHLERSLPYSLAFALVAYIVLFRFLRNRSDSRHGYTFVVLTFSFCFLVYGTIILSGAHRVLFFLLPLYVLVVCVGFYSTISLFFPKKVRAFGISPADRRAATVAIVLGLSLSVGLSTLKQVDFRGVREGRESLGDFVVASVRQGPSFFGLLRDGYGMPCGYSWNCDQKRAQEFAELAAAVEPEDILISDLPMETNYFVGRINGWLYLPRDDLGLSSIDDDAFDEYFGLPIVNTAEEVAELAESANRVWIITRRRDISAAGETRQRVWDSISRRFVLHLDGTHLQAYSNR
jgi:hypothetical protein